MIWIVDAQHDGRRFIVAADEKLSAFVELERVTREALRFPNADRRQNPLREVARPGLVRAGATLQVMWRPIVQIRLREGKYILKFEDVRQGQVKWDLGAGIDLLTPRV